MVTAEQRKRKQNRKPCILRRYQPGLYMADMQISGKITIFKCTGPEDITDHSKISITTPRKNCVFSNGKAYLFDKPNRSRRDVRDAIRGGNFKE